MLSLASRSATEEEEIAHVVVEPPTRTLSQQEEMEGRDVEEAAASSSSSNPTEDPPPPHGGRISLYDNHHNEEDSSTMDFCSVYYCCKDLTEFVILCLLLFLFFFPLVLLILCFLLIPLSIFVVLCHCCGGSFTATMEDSALPPHYHEENTSRPTMTRAQINAQLATRILKETQQCDICLDEIPSHTTVACSHHCIHVYHVDCMKEWLTKSNTCPTCRRPYFKTQNHPEESDTRENPRTPASPTTLVVASPFEEDDAERPPNGQNEDAPHNTSDLPQDDDVTWSLSSVAGRTVPTGAIEEEDDETEPALEPSSSLGDDTAAAAAAAASDEQV